MVNDDELGCQPICVLSIRINRNAMNRVVGVVVVVVALVGCT